jgi:phosphatidylglycerophosphate synthase
MNLLSPIKEAVRSVMRTVARALNKLSGGHLSPHAVTVFGLLAHVPIAILIARGYFGYAAVGLIVFGLFDTLDGELARLQNRASNLGMFLDSTTDRLKEIMIYVGLAFALVAFDKPYMAVWALAAVGLSLLTSYINAWGDVVLARVNSSLRGGFLPFEVRMTLIIIALLTSRLSLLVVFIAIGAGLTVLDRSFRIIRKLS